MSNKQWTGIMWAIFMVGTAVSKDIELLFSVIILGIYFLYELIKDMK